MEGIPRGRNTRLAPYGEQTYGEQTVYDDQPVELLDEPAEGLEFLAYGSTPSMAKRDYFLPEDIPLFLSNGTEEPRQRRFGSGGDRDFHRAGCHGRGLSRQVFLRFHGGDRS